MIVELAPSPAKTFLAAFVLSSVAGFSAQLRDPAPINVRLYVTSAINSGLLGMAMAMLWFEKFRDNLHFLVAICILAGLAGRPLVDAVASDFVILVRRRLGLRLGGEKPTDADTPRPSGGSG